MISGKKPRDLSESGGPSGMQYLVLCNAAMTTSFAVEVSLSPALFLSFRMFSDDIPCLNIFSRSSFGRKEIVICLK